MANQLIFEAKTNVKPIELAPQVDSTLNQLIHCLTDNNQPDDSVSFKLLLKQYGRLKGVQGKKSISVSLGLNDEELSLFDTALRDLNRKNENSDSTDEILKRNILIAQLRFFSWIETIVDRKPEIKISLNFESVISEDIARKQIRALELIIRSLINESYHTQNELIKRLKSTFPNTFVEKWQKGADHGNILSGTTFSELASLFVNKDEYPRYNKYFEDTPFLTLLKDRRQTIQNFLDDIRRIRNILSHNKQISNVQLTLLDLYYEEVTEPVQTAHDHGQTKVNPDEHLDASKEELDAYFSDLHEDILTVKDSITDLKTSIEQSIGVVSKDTSDIKKTTKVIHKKLIYIAAVSVTILIVSLFATFQQSGIKEDTSTITTTTERIEKNTKKTSESIATMAATSKKSVAAINDIANGVKVLAQSGGLVANPTAPAELYHNARLLAQRGEVDRALQSYKKLLSYNLLYADPIQDLVTLLKNNYDNESIDLALKQVFNTDNYSPAREYANALIGKKTKNIVEQILANKIPFLPILMVWVENLENSGLTYQELRAYVSAIEHVNKAFDSGKAYDFYIDKIRAEATFRKFAGYSDKAKQLLNNVLSPISISILRGKPQLRKQPAAFEEDMDKLLMWLQMPIVYEYTFGKFIFVVKDTLNTNRPEFYIRVSGSQDLISETYRDKWIDLYLQEKFKVSDDYATLISVSNIFKPSNPYTTLRVRGDAFIEVKYTDRNGKENFLRMMKLIDNGHFSRQSKSGVLLMTGELPLSREESINNAERLYSLQHNRQ